MSSVQTVKTLFVEAGDVRYAYRRLGQASGTPILFLMHFRGTIDHWDPDLISPFAKKYPVILFDNAGVGHSSGEVPTSIAEMAEHVEAFIDALEIPRLIIYGFSLGGMVAQQVALDVGQRGLLEKLILSGTSPGRGINGGSELSKPDDEEVGRLGTHEIVGIEPMLKLFFWSSPTSVAAGRDWWLRIFNRNKSTSGEERTEYVKGKGIEAQAIALGKWANGEGAYGRLEEIKIPTFVSNGYSDFMLPTQHSYFMSQRIPSAHLHIYPDSGHGHCFQFPKLHAEHVLSFLAQ